MATSWAAPRQAAIGLAAALFLASCGEAATHTESTSAPAPTAQAVAPTAPSAVRIQGVQRVFDEPQLSDGKPLTLFVGGQFCPFCASMRWPLVKALARFGTFSGLGQIQTQAGYDGFQSLASYEMTRASYKSDYVSLRVVEVGDPTGRPLQRPDAQATTLLNRFDPRGAIPFVFMAGSYVAQLPYSPALLQGRTFQQILDEVNSPTPGRIGQAINAEADIFTALICKSGGLKPSEVCGQPAIPALIQQAP